ncbi:MAG TPA: cyanophycin synthetase [Paracoccaceae bacterium]|nr:cyanophycin synthetase [Paracoccaceae bacterium]
MDEIEAQRAAALLHHRRVGPGEGLAPPIHPAVTLHLPQVEGAAHVYGRNGMPGWDAVEGQLALLEDAPCVAFPSGMAAITAALMATLKAGDRVILPADGYYVTRVLARDFLAGFGVEAVELPTRAYPQSDFAGAAVVWADDAWSDRAIAHAMKRGLRLFTVGEKGEGIRLMGRTPTQLGQLLEIELEGAVHKVNLPLIGAYQAANALVAAGLVLATGGQAAQVLDALSRLQPVRGRLERAALNRHGAPVYVDYAHTPDALDAAIAALRPHTQGRLIVVFGAGGDRDRGKRPLMGRVAAMKADLAIVTDDNPRGEDAAQIRREVLAGCTNGREIADRREAIAAAMAEAGAADIVLIAGKGHEQGQIVGSGAAMRVLPFDDVTVARESV